MQGHKHDDILTQIVTMLRSSTTRVKILKVRAHVGITDNETADAVAKDASLASHQETFTAASNAGRGRAWVRYPADPTRHPGAESDLLYDADNLNGSVLNKARQAYERQLWRSLSRSLPPADQTHTRGNTPSITKHTKKGAAERFFDVHEQSGGVHEQISGRERRRHATKAYNPFCGPDLIDTRRKNGIQRCSR